MPQQDPERLDLRKPVKSPHRTAAFREAARAIVHKDRYDRRAGFSVDTAGAVARALERAYAQGFADAQASPSVPAPASQDIGLKPGKTGEPIEWVLIPPRPRHAFWIICFSTLGGEMTAAKTPGHLVPAQTRKGTTGWQLASGNGSNEPLGHATILPLLRLGLLSVGLEPNRRLVVSEVGRATWRRFLDRGGQFPEDLTTPPRYGAAP